MFCFVGDMVCCVVDCCCFMYKKCIVLFNVVNGLCGYYFCMKVNFFGCFYKVSNGVFVIGWCWFVWIN